MNETFITLLLFGSLKDPILWILSFTIGSGLLVKKNRNHINFNDPLENTSIEKPEGVFPRLEKNND